MQKFSSLFLLAFFSAPLAHSLQQLNPLQLQCGASINEKVFERHNSISFAENSLQKSQLLISSNGTLVTQAAAKQNPSLVMYQITGTKNLNGTVCISIKVNGEEKLGAEDPNNFPCSTSLSSRAYGTGIHITIGNTPVHVFAVCQ